MCVVWFPSWGVGTRPQENHNSNSSNYILFFGDFVGKKVAFLRPEVVANAADGSLQEPTVVSRATSGF